MQETVLITGGAGLVGARLSQTLTAEGYTVRHISRNCTSKTNIPCFSWDLETIWYDPAAIIGVDFIIHLAGANVAEGRWTNHRKKQILDSRVKGSKLVCKMVEDSKGKIKRVVSASAVGYYGVSNGHELLNETTSAGNDFLAEVCVQWEKEISACKTDVSILRTGVVLSAQGGAIPKMLAPIKWGLGSPLGSGDQLMPWIHIDDLCNMYVFALKNRLCETYNAVAPQVVSNKDLTIQLSKAVNRRILLPNVPTLVLKVMLGEMAGLLVTGVNVSSAKIENEGFNFEFPTLESSLMDLI